MGESPIARKPQRSIAARLLTAVFIISSAATLVFTVLELVLDYSNGEQAIVNELDHAASSTQASIARMLWNVDVVGAKETLAGLDKLAHVNGAMIQGASITEIAVGAQPTSDDLVRRYPLLYGDSGQSQSVGELVLISSREEYNDFFVQKSIIFVILRALKATLASLFIYWAIHRMLTRHLLAVVDFLRSASIQRAGSDLKLERQSRHSDELDALVESVNGLFGRLQQSVGALSELNANLETRVAEQSRQAIARQRELDANARLAALGRMASGIAHEVKNPLAVIIGNVQMMRKVVTTGLDDQDILMMRLEKAEKAAGRIDRIIMAMSRLMGSESTDAEYAVANLKLVLMDLHELAEMRCGKEGVTLQVDLPSDEIYVRSSAIHLGQVLLNLVSNGCDAVAGCSSPKIHVGWQVANDTVAIVVTDNGHGIAPENAARIMEPFFTTKEPGKGVGLGLSLSRSIIQRYGGTMTVVSKPGETQFTVTLAKENYAEVS